MMRSNTAKKVINLSVILLALPMAAKATTYSSSYSYDVPNGQVTKTDPNGNRLQYTYNAVNKLSELKLLDATGTPTFSYHYDLTDQLERITYPSGQQIFGYDNFDRLETIKDFGQANPMLVFTYDHQDRITWITYPDGGDVCYEYDADGRMKRVGRVLPPGGVTDCASADEKTDFIYDTKGRLDTVSYPNGVEKFQTYYSATGQIKSVGYHRQTGGELIYSDTFVYIPNSNLYDTVTRTTTAGADVTDYDYDAYERLTEVLETSSGRKTVYQYDNFGNRTHETITNINDAQATGGTPKEYGAYVYEYADKSNRLNKVLKNDVELERYVYDNAGRIRQRIHAIDGLTEYDFDDRGLLTKVTKPGTTVEYSYDGLGVRKSKTVNGVTTKYLTANIFGFSHVLMELDASLNIKSTYAYAGHLPLKEEPVAADRSQDLYLLHSGVVGSVSHALDATGAIKHEYAYDAFGLRSDISSSGGSHKHYGYTGEEQDAETGLVYLRARYYDPSLGRFVSADPYWGSLEEPASQNRYTYVHNKPLELSDPSGLCAMLTPVCLHVARNASGAVITAGGTFAASMAADEGWLQATKKAAWAGTTSLVFGFATGRITNTTGKAIVSSGAGNISAQTMFNDEYSGSEFLIATGSSVVPAYLAKGAKAINWERTGLVGAEAIQQSSEYLAKGTVAELRYKDSQNHLGIVDNGNNCGYK